MELDNWLKNKSIKRVTSNFSIINSTDQLNEDGEIINIISLQGGLGNQLFEWAFAQRLISQGTRIVFDTTRCRGDRPLEIGPLIEQDRTLPKLLGLGIAGLVKMKILTESRSVLRRLQFVKEQDFSYDVGLVDELTVESGRLNYVLGYFQSPKYFQSHETHVRSAVLGLLNSMLTDTGRLAAERYSQDESSVAVHVRRGDYVSNADAAVHHGALKNDYYKRSLELVRNLGKQNIIWFSDDTDWVSENLARPEDTIFTPSMGAEMTLKAGGEIALMAACSSRVIANSSFSWWAGWLGAPSTANSPIIAPDRWFSANQNGALDLIPERWLRI